MLADVGPCTPFAHADELLPSKIHVSDCELLAIALTAVCVSDEVRARSVAELSFFENLCESELSAIFCLPTYYSPKLKIY